MQITVSVATVIAVLSWAAGTGLMLLAALDVWRGGWVGIAMMPVCTCAWLQHRLRREATRLESREDAAFALGAARVRSIN